MGARGACSYAGLTTQEYNVSNELSHWERNGIAEQVMCWQRRSNRITLPERGLSGAIRYTGQNHPVRGL